MYWNDLVIELVSGAGYHFLYKEWQVMLSYTFGVGDTTQAIYD